MFSSCQNPLKATEKDLIKYTKSTFFHFSFESKKCQKI
jgi:hypothetical protein